MSRDERTVIQAERTMIQAECTVIQAECTVITALPGLGPSEGAEEVTLSDEPTLFWSRQQGVLAGGQAQLASAPKKEPRLVLQGADKKKAARFDWAAIAHEKLRFPPQELSAALAWGAFAGLVLATGLVIAIRGNVFGSSAFGSSAFQRRGEAAAGPRSAEVRVWTKTGEGSPVSDAHVWVGEQTGTTDGQGSYTTQHPREPQIGSSDEVQVRVECPRGYVGRETRRVVRWTGAPTQPSNSESRELTVYCEVELVELALDLKVERGEARFRLGDRELGSTEGGRLRREVLVPAHSEQVLTAEPVLGPKQRAPVRVVGGTRVFQVGERPGSEEHTVELIWPRTKSGGRKAIPYRL